MKRFFRDKIILRKRSPPTRGRGLKRLGKYPIFQVLLSPPTRGRGLKPEEYLSYRQALAVAPHAGAWIETTDRTV
mgnify:CR=1 FL=1